MENNKELTVEELQEAGFEILEEEQECNTFFVNEEFGDNLTNRMCEFISNLDPNSEEPIHIKIISNGGDLYSLLSIMDMLESTNRKIYTYAYGFAKSCGMHLLCFGHRRQVGRWAEIMWHTLAMKPRNHINSVEGRELFKDLDKQQDKLDDFIISKTKITKKQLKKYRNKDWEMDYNDCIKWGIDNSKEYDELHMEKN